MIKEIILESIPTSGYRSVRAANSVDIDLSKSLVHHLTIDNIKIEDYNIGLIVGNSGSGKTTLAKNLFNFEDILLDENNSIIEQLDESLSYDECKDVLVSVGLSSIPCWIRKVKELSNGQRARAEIALKISKCKELIVVDEWTSVVDRDVAKVMSASIAKFARSKNRKIVLISCHYDIIEWLNPCWIIDCNDQTFTDRRFLWQTYERKEKLNFEIKECSSKLWTQFSKYHYLTQKIGSCYFSCGLYLKDRPIGIIIFNKLIPQRQNYMHSTRLVIHPDFAGFGLGINFEIICSRYLKSKGYRIFSITSQYHIVKAQLKRKCYRLIDCKIPIKVRTSNFICRTTEGLRNKVKLYNLEFIDG